MDWKDHIVKDPRILAGKPTVKGTRISVQLVTELLDAGVWTEADILRNYPRLTTDDLEACRLYAATGQPLGFVTWDDLEAMLDEDDRRDAAQRRQSKQS
jgi:uncharacterized protein (DUF433 family)